MKTCTNCGKEKPLSEFHRDSSKSDGRESQCGTCSCAEKTAAWIVSHPDYQPNFPAFNEKGQRRCRRCKTYKDPRHFRGHVGMARGLYSTCKMCTVQEKKDECLRDMHQKRKGLVGKICHGCGKHKEPIEFPVYLKNLGPWCTDCCADPKTMARVEAQIGINPAVDLIIIEAIIKRKIGASFKTGRLVDLTPGLLVPLPTHCPVFPLIKLIFHIVLWESGLRAGPKETAIDRDCSLSLDRIDNEQDYVDGNVIFVSNRANTLKSNATMEELQTVVNFYRNLGLI